MALYNPSSTPKSYLSIKPGETKVIKKSAKIISAINYGGVNYTSACNLDIPVENAVCYSMTWSTSGLSVGSDIDSVLYNNVINYIEILGTQYPVNVAADYETTGVGYGATDSNRLEDLLKGLIPTSLLRITGITQLTPGDTNERHTFEFKFQTIPSIASTIEMKISELPAPGRRFDTGYLNGLYVRPVPCDPIILT